MYVRVVQVDAITDEFSNLTIYIGHNAESIAIYILDYSKFSSVELSSDLSWLAFEYSSVHDHPTIPQVLSYFEKNVLISFSRDLRRIMELDNVFNLILSRMIEKETQVFLPTLAYIMIKIKWLLIQKQVRLNIRGESSDRIQRLFNAMNQNHTEHRGVKHYAKEIYVSEHYLRELCQKELRLNFRYLSNLLLAIRIIDEFVLVRRPFGDIAFDLGFSDQSHFTNFFKRQLGVTPSEFRQGILIFK